VLGVADADMRAVLAASVRLWAANAPGPAPAKKEKP
jgi:hypothetical protein